MIVSHWSNTRESTPGSTTNLFRSVGRALHSEASFGGGDKAGVAPIQAVMGLQEKDVKEKAKHERLISRKGRNRLLGTAFGCLMLDTLLSFIFCLMAPADPRLRNVYASRRQLRTVTIQGVIALFDAIISAGVVVHVVAGILSASLDSFLEAAATKLLQAIFFSLLQTGYPTVLRLTMITLLLLLRVTAAALIFRAAFLTGVLTARPSCDLPKVIVSLLEMGAPVANPQLRWRLHSAVMYAHERPLTYELIERLIRWLVPLRERAAAAGMGRRQVLLIGAFLTLMTGWTAFFEYWSILGDQDEFFFKGQLETIETRSFAHLAAVAYAAGQSVRTVAEARPFLPINVTQDQHRVVSVVLSGLRFDAFEQAGDGPGAALSRWRTSLDPSSSLLCRLTAEVPSLGVPNWVGLSSGLRPEIHGLLGNRGPAVQEYSSVFEVLRQLDLPAVLVGTPWHVDLMRDAVRPFEGDGSVSASALQYEAFDGTEADVYDAKREAALIAGLNTSARFVSAQLSQINTAGYLRGASYADGSAYAAAIAAKAALLERIVHILDTPGAPPTTLIVLSDHGHLPRGGAGGGSAEERAVPLLTYRLGSRLGETVGAGGMVEPSATARCVSGAHSIIDVPSTIAGLLGVPVPRHCQGAFIEALFDASEAAPFDAAMEAAGVELVGLLGAHSYRTLRWWQWQDLYYQRHAFADQYLLNPDVNRRGDLDSLDTAVATTSLLEAADNRGDASAYQQLLVELERLLQRARNQASVSSATRNQFVAAFILLLIMVLIIFAMQIQTFCDPFVFLIPSRAWRYYADTQAALLCLGLVVAYYAVAFAIFVGFLAANSWPWSSAIVALPEHIYSFLLVTLLPGTFVAHLCSRALLLRYAVWPIFGSISPLSLVSFCLFDEIQAFRQMEMAYLGCFYLVLWSLFASCLLGVLSSRYTFIVPLVFYNKYIDASMWEFRFMVMTVQVMTVPLLIVAMWNLFKWPAVRVDLLSIAAINELKVAKYDRRQGLSKNVDEHSFIQAALQRTGSVCAGARGSGTNSVYAIAMSTVADEDEDGGDGGRGIVSASSGSGGELDLATRFEAVHQEILERRQEQVDMHDDMRTIHIQQGDLQDEIDGIMVELSSNQEQINAGVQELETLIVRRFEEMQQAEEDEKAAKAALAIDQETKIGSEEDDDAFVAGLDPAARRQLRRQRLIEEQRKRIAVEEAEKAEADEKIRQMQAELAKLLEANKRLQHKVEMCEHTLDEARDAIEDMSFQMSQCTVQKENALSVLISETNYLTEHQVTVQRKASELTSRMAEVEASTAAAGYKLHRVHHSNELRTADRRRELEGLQAEAEAMQDKFDHLRDDVRVLYGDKAALLDQLTGVQAEAAEVEQTVTRYQKSTANLVA